VLTVLSWLEITQYIIQNIQSVCHSSGTAFVRYDMPLPCHHLWVETSYMQSLPLAACCRSICAHTFKYVTLCNSVFLSLKLLHALSDVTHKTDHEHLQSKCF